MPIVLGAAVVAALLVVGATWTGFYPRQISVTGNRRVTRGEILENAAIAPRVSIWLQNTAAMSKRIEAIPYVATARVHRVPPATIRIAVVERKPFAVVRSGAAEAVVDRTLRVLAPVGDGDPRPLLVLPPGLALVPGRPVPGAAAVELRDADEALEAGHIAAAKLALDRFGGLVVTLHDGIRLLLGAPAGLGRKVVLADAILRQVVRGQHDVAAVDLRAPSAPVVIYR